VEYSDLRVKGEKLVLHPELISGYKHFSEAGNSLNEINALLGFPGKQAMELYKLFPNRYLKIRKAVRSLRLQQIVVPQKYFQLRFR